VFAGQVVHRLNDVQDLQIGPNFFGKGVRVFNGCDRRISENTF
jgi:hypothetical protein